MGKCDSCGNSYDKSFKVTISGKTYTFHSFECAIRAVRCVTTAVYRLLGMGWKKTEECFVVVIASLVKA
ncbi:hypothetical protein [Pollutimonas nitritireducens]|uniref:hypothetical protein n=1 Tax=Pollutimonas nitritireducens TaxID=2045209 RepID=UPI001E3F8AE5|nr:hypothetical protein [Pollutimonas nitritireducens]